MMRRMEEESEGGKESASETGRGTERWWKGERKGEITRER